MTQTVTLIPDAGTPATSTLEETPAAENVPERGTVFRPEPWCNEAVVAQHIAMVDAYRRTGGLVSGAEVALLLRKYSTQPISLLARWIVTRSVVSYVWRSEILVPLFQFDRDDMSLRREISEVIDELADTFDDWETAAWFVQPNSWLQDATPVDLIGVNQSAVLQAARADRFVARG